MLKHNPLRCVAFGGGPLQGSGVGGSGQGHQGSPVLVSPEKQSQQAADEILVRRKWKGKKYRYRSSDT